MCADFCIMITGVIYIYIYSTYINIFDHFAKHMDRDYWFVVGGQNKCKSKAFFSQNNYLEIASPTYN